MEQGPKFQGTLEKQCRMKTWTWKKYWFVLKDDQLTYVKNQDKVASQGHIDLSQVQSVRVTSGNHGYPLEVVTRSRTHLLSAGTNDQREKWVKALHTAMAWSTGRKTSRSSSINSARASCNSILDEDDEMNYGNVSPPPKPSSPSMSSGYNSSSSSRNSEAMSKRSSNDIPTASRDSGTDDLMVTNTDYYMHCGDSIKSSDADNFARNSGKSVTDTDKKVVHYEDIENENPNKHENLKRLHQKKIPVVSNTDSRVFSPRESTRSDISDIYDEVRDPTVTLAISHIVKGYANIARNKGPQPDNQDTDNKEQSEDNPYDEVFDAMPTERQSNVIMRRSVQRQSDPDMAYEYAEALMPKVGTPDGNYSHASKTGTNHPIKSPDHKSPAVSGLSEYFTFTPVPDLQHPRVELTEQNACNEIRLFLANNRGPSEYYSKVKKKEKSEGEGIKLLQDFLNTLCV